MTNIRAPIRLLVIAGLLALSFYAGVRFVAGPAAPRHPLTGRQIAGIATNRIWLDRTEREREEAPEQALALAGIGPGMVVADVGAGTGYMTMRIARLVGPSGMVYATDIQPAMLREIQEKARTEQVSNVEIVQSTETESGLPDGRVDLALLVDVYHELTNPQSLLKSIRRSLKPDGRLVLVEYRKEDPTIPIADTHRMSVADARVEVEAEGFVFDRLVSGLPRQHIMIFKKPADVGRLFRAGKLRRV